MRQQRDREYMGTVYPDNHGEDQGPGHNHHYE